MVETLAGNGSRATADIRRKRNTDSNHEDWAALLVHTRLEKAGGDTLCRFCNRYRWSQQRNDVRKKTERALYRQRQGGKTQEGSRASAEESGGTLDSPSSLFEIGNSCKMRTAGASWKNGVTRMFSEVLPPTSLVAVGGLPANLHRGSTSHRLNPAYIAVVTHRHLLLYKFANRRVHVHGRPLDLGNESQNY